MFMAIDITLSTAVDAELTKIMSDGILKVFHIIVLFSSQVALRADDSLVKCANCFAFR